MADFNTHGGYFAPKGWMEVNAGGSHEENPNGGVQIGVDEQGIPNMLEEGEPVYDDYVYSDNIKADARILKKMNLPEKYGGKLYSEIAEDFLKEAEERPLDPISNNGLQAMLGRLADSQEEQKARKEKRELKKEIESLSPEELAMLESALSGEEAVPVEQQVTPEAAAQQPMALPGTMPQMMANGGILIRKFEEGTPGELSADSLNRINRKLVELNALASKIITGNSRSNSEMTKMFNDAAGRINLDGFSDYEKQLILDRLGDIAEDAIKGNQSLGGDSFRYYDSNGEYVRNKNYDNMVRKARKDIDFSTPEKETFTTKDYRDTLGPNYFDRRKIAKGISDATGGYFKPVDIMRYFSSKAQDVVPGNASFAYDKRYPELSEEFFADLISQHPSAKDAILSYINGLPSQASVNNDESALNFNDNPQGSPSQTTGIEAWLSGAQNTNNSITAQPVPAGSPSTNSANAPSVAPVATMPSVPAGQRSGRTTALPSNTRLVPVPEFPLDDNTIADEALNTANNALDGSVIRDINPIGNTPLSLNYKASTADTGLAPRRAPVNTTADSSSDDTGIRTPMLPTFPRYAGALTSAALGLYNMAQTPDRYNIPNLVPNLVEGEMPIQLQRYMPIDVNIPLNAIQAQGNASARAIANAGLGPSVGANLIANNAATTNALGTGFLQAYQANNQQRNNVIAANNAALAQQAAFNQRRNAMNAQILNHTAAQNLQNNLYEQRLNYDAEAQKYAAIQNQLDQAAGALSSIGRENFMMNQINGDEGYRYFIAPNGNTFYKVNRKCGGKIKTKK